MGENITTKKDLVKHDSLGYLINHYIRGILIDKNASLFLTESIGREFWSILDSDIPYCYTKEDINWLKNLNISDWMQILCFFEDVKIIRIKWENI